jgi:hypothetical protein
MATPTEIIDSIELDLKCVGLMLADIPEVAAERDSLLEGEQASWDADWSQIIYADLAEMDKAYRAGAMQEERAERYRAILAELKASLPTLMRLRLTLPTVSLEP